MRETLLQTFLQAELSAVTHCSLGGFGLLSLRIMAMECGETDHVLQTVPKAHPDQACSLQGSRDVSCDILAANDLGTGSGW